jgi:hypothetical protein
LKAVLAKMLAPSTFTGAYVWLIHALQGSQEPQWRHFKLATDVLTESQLLNDGAQNCIRLRSSTAGATSTCHRDHKLKNAVFHLCHRMQVACELLARQMKSCIQVPSLHCLQPQTLF